MRIAIAGTGFLGASLMRPLLESHHQVVALIQDGRETKGAKRAFIETCYRAFGFDQSILSVALRHRVPVIWIDRMQDQDLAPLRALAPDIILVGGFSIIFRKAILDLPRIGCVNTHTSLLPRHRGPNPFSAVILANEKETGVTFHVMDEGIDTGPIVQQFTFPIEPTDTGLDLYNRGCEFAAHHVVGVMNRIEKKGIEAISTPQDNSKASYDKRFERENTVIDWRKTTAEIDRLTRACKPFFIPRFVHRNATIYLTQVKFDERPVNAPPGTVLAVRPFIRVATGLGSVTVVNAYTGSPFPWIWPTRRSRPAPGEKLG